MKTCSTCGNKIHQAVVVCPFCDSPQEQQTQSAPKKEKSRVKKILLKEGQPTVAEAIEKLRVEITNGTKSGISVLKVVHGYGSSGVGGAIKQAVLPKLRRWKDDAIIKNYMTGEDHFEYGARHNYLLKKYPELSDTWHSDRGNPGITFIEL